MAQAKAELGYAPRTTFEDGIARTVAWYRDDYWPQFGATFAADLLGQSRLGLGLGGLDSGSSSSSLDGPPTEELEQWPGGAERRARSLSGSLAADQDEPTAAAAKAEQRRLRCLLPRTLPRALPPAATALLASLHLDVRTRAQVTQRPTLEEVLGFRARAGDFFHRTCNHQPHPGPNAATPRDGVGVSSCSLPCCCCCCCCAPRPRR
jgi:hypothetical protein